MLACRQSVFILCCIILSACASGAGLREFTLYNDSFDQFNEVSKGIIDKLAVAEREQKQRLRESARPRGYDSRFVVKDASIYSEAVDPPLADQYRRGIGVIASYNKLMLAYATGKGFDELENEAVKLAGESIALIDAISVASDLTGALTPYLSVLRKFAHFGLQQRSRQVFQEEIITSAPQVILLLETLRDGTVQVFPRLTESVTAQINRTRFGEAGDRAALIKQHRDIRVMLSDWVVLMNLNIKALRAVIVAVRDPFSNMLAANTTTIIELREAASEARKHLAKL